MTDTKRSLQSREEYDHASPFDGKDSLIMVLTLSCLIVVLIFALICSYFMWKLRQQRDQIARVAPADDLATPAPTIVRMVKT
jgi:heme/copper-type cytochrome/quinol oxidase subunit 2